MSYQKNFIFSGSRGIIMYVVERVQAFVFSILNYFCFIAILAFDDFYQNSRISAISICKSSLEMHSRLFHSLLFCTFQICRPFSIPRRITKLLHPSIRNFGISAIDDAQIQSAANVHRKWDLKGLKSESSRSYLRAFKKVGKLKERWSKASAKLADGDDLRGTENDPEVIEIEIQVLQTKLNSLGKLEDGLKSIRSVDDPAFKALSALAIELDVGDVPPPAQPRGETKPKGKTPPPRKPYFEYKSAEGVVIRVGRTSADNDKLSCDPEYRDDRDWWLHVSGYAGSHVVIRYTEDDLPQRYPETLYDAAALAAVNSKGPQSGKTAVSFTRCRDVRKPPGAKPGLVQLKGNVGLLDLYLNSEAKRLARLESSKLE